MLDIILLVIGLIALLIGALADIAWREVPDMISYGFLAAAIAVRVLYAMQEQTWTVLIDGGFGLLAGLGLGMIMFYTGQWGGADAKLLYGIGAVFGLTGLYLLQPFILFLGFLLVSGAVYGIAFSYVLLVKNWKKCRKPIQDLLLKHRAWKYAAFGTSSLMILFGLFQNGALAYLWMLLALVLTLTFYLWVYIKVIESKLMIKEVLLPEVTEGDWIAEDVVVDGRTICGPADLGIEEKQLEELKRSGVDKVLVKYGIPFVPSFFIAYVATVIWFFK